jgi:hypothetical protein
MVLADPTRVVWTAMLTWFHHLPDSGLDSFNGATDHSPEEAMFPSIATTLRRGVPTIAIAGALLVVSATGGATAALVITGKQIKDNSVTTKDIKNGTLKSKDLAASTVAALKGNTGATGPAGPAGPQGATGPVGATGGFTGVQRVSVDRTVNASGDYYGSAFVTVACPTGKIAVSGGYYLASSAVDVAVHTSRPNATGTAWEVYVRSSTSSFSATFYALCANSG